jgi:hypothetical protein
VQQLNRLETTSYTIEKVIEAGVEGNVLYDLLYADKLLLIAHGTVIAGVDLSKLTEQDITISDDGHSLTVRLPPVQILSSTLDNQKTRIYRRDQALFADNPGLETQARQAAEDQILKAACEDNILLKASQESQKALQQLFSLAEFDQVSVVAAPPGPCVAPADAGAPAP